MKGIEICKKYYQEYGKPMLEAEFSDLLPNLAVGVFGSGSECFGYDDDISRDHDFEAGFCIMLPGEDVVDRKRAFALERAYAKLPKSFMGIERGKLSPVGGNRRGVISVSEFFAQKIGRADGLLSGEEWFSVPESYLAEVTNGEIFFDGNGSFSAIREYLSTYPEDVKLKKLAGKLLLSAQAGQYNYKRCLAHGEVESAQLAVFDFVNNAIDCVFLLNNKYRPFYKWTFRALKGLDKLSDLYDSFSFLLTTDNSPENAGLKSDVIEGICSKIISVLIDENLSSAVCGDLEKHAYSVNDRVKDINLRNAHILYGVK